MGNEEYRQEGINMQLKPIKDKIEALELAIKNSPLNSHLKEQIAKLQKRLDEQLQNDMAFKIDINELKEEFNKLKQLIPMEWQQKHNTKGIINLEEVLQDHLKSHIVVARDQLTNKDKIIIFREFDKAIEDQLKKLDSKPKTVKKEVCEDCLYEKTFDTKICAICIPNSNKSQFKPKDSGGEKSWDEQHPEARKAMDKAFIKKEKLPEPICPFCGRKLIRYKQAWICGHGCTKPALKPKMKAEPEKDYFEELKKHPEMVCLTCVFKNTCKRCGVLARQGLIEGFIKFIDHFEERYEGNKCGECLEYWKTIKEHYKGA